MSNPAPIVFISYSHDSEEHRQRVLRLAERLRYDGYQTRLDEYVNGTPAEGWPNWMMNQLDDAAFTLVVCTETYYKRYRGKDAPDRGLGVAFEGVLITNELYETKCQSVKFVPILFDPTHKQFIPEPLRGATHYVLNYDSEYQELRKFLDGAAGIEPGAVGAYTPHVRATGTPLTFPGPPSAKPNNLPFTSLHDLFMGRGQALDELHGRLAKQSGGAAAVVARQAIHGLGGVGKTRLAIEYAHRHEADYAALLFVTADSPEKLQTNLAGLTETLPLSHPAPDDQLSQVKAVLAWLAANPGWLLILDNVVSKAAAKEVEKLLPRLSAGQVLITSRIREMQYSGSVATTWLTSFKHLTAGAQALLNRLAWFAPDPIPNAILAQAPTGDAATGASAEDLLQELLDFSLVAREPNGFVVHRLVQDVTRCQLRKLVVTKPLQEALEWIDASFQGDPSDVRTWPRLLPLAPHAQAVTSYADASQITDPTSRLMNELAVLLQATNRLAEAEPLMRRVVDISEKSLGENQPNVATALSNLAQLLKATNQLAEAEPLMRRALAIGEQLYGPEHPSVAIRLNNLALLLQTTNRMAEAEPLMRRALAIDERSYGPEHPDVARDLNNLALLLKATNRLAEAKPLMRRALTIDEQLYGPEHPRVAIELNNLAQLLRAMNRLAEAEPMMRRALAIDEQSYGLEHPDVAIRLNNLAVLLQATNRLAEAEPLMRRALAIDEQSYGPEHPNVARDLNNLASFLQATNRLEEAEPLMRRALAIDEQSYGPEHPNVARDLNNLALLLQATNRLVEAEPLMRRALAIDEQSYGLEHSKVATDLNNLAQLLEATNRLAEAEPLMRRAVEIFEAFQRTTGYQHPRYDVANRNLESIVSKLR